MGKVGHVCNLSILEAKAEGLGIQGNPQLCRNFEAKLYKTLSKKQTTTKPIGKAIILYATHLQNPYLI